MKLRTYYFFLERFEYKQLLFFWNSSPNDNHHHLMSTTTNGGMIPPLPPPPMSSLLPQLPDPQLIRGASASAVVSLAMPNAECSTQCYE